MDAESFHEALADKAIQFRASVERDYMVISVVSLSENLPEAMRLLQLALTLILALRSRSGHAGADQDLQSLAEDDINRLRWRGAIFPRPFSMAMPMPIPAMAMPPASRQSAARISGISPMAIGCAGAWKFPPPATSPQTPPPS